MILRSPREARNELELAFLREEVRFLRERLAWYKRAYYALAFYGKHASLTDDGLPSSVSDSSGLECQS